MEELKVASPSWANSSIALFNALFKAQLFDDWPAPDVAAYKPKPRQGSRSSEGFDDFAFTEILRAALWLNEIQSEVLDAYLATRDIKKTDQGSCRLSLVMKYRRKMVRSWSSEKLKEGTIFPFWIDLPGEATKVRRFDVWPLDTVRSLKTFLHKCQTANAIMILGSTGMRIGELASLNKNSLVSRDGRYFLRAQSFKDSDIFAGEDRQWPLPDVAARAFKAQVELVSTLGSGDNLWYPFNEGRNKRGLPSFLAVLKNFGQTIGPKDGGSLAQIDGDISPHRFRFTIARLVALSLTGASQVLFDVLGHDDVEVTLGYAHQDPELHEDINRIRAEVKAIRVKEVFDDSDEISGSAAYIVRRAKADMLARSGEIELETSEVNEVAEILGDAEVVKPGVLCTAQPLERGGLFIVSRLTRSWRLHASVHAPSRTRCCEARPTSPSALCFRAHGRGGYCLACLLNKSDCC